MNKMTNTNIVKPASYNRKIIKPNIKRNRCKRCGNIKEQNSSDYCIACNQVMAFKKEKDARDNENAIELDGVNLVSPNNMTDTEFMSWVTQTQAKPFITKK